jgi:hypothetical protein
MVTFPWCARKTKTCSSNLHFLISELETKKSPVRTLVIYISRQACKNGESAHAILSTPFFLLRQVGQTRFNTPKEGGCFGYKIYSPFHSFKILVLSQEQGDQIGRIFAYWAMVNFGHFFENYRSSINILGTLFHGKNCVLILTNIRVGLHFGRFFHRLILSPWLRNLSKLNEFFVQEIGRSEL